MTIPPQGSQVSKQKVKYSGQILADKYLHIHVDIHYLRTKPSSYVQRSTKSLLCTLAISQLMNNCYSETLAAAGRHALR